MTLDLIDFLMKFSFSLFLFFYLQVSSKKQHHFMCVCECVVIRCLLCFLILMAYELMDFSFYTHLRLNVMDRTSRTYTGQLNIHISSVFAGIVIEKN